MILKLVRNWLSLFEMHDTPRTVSRYQEPTPRERLEIQAAAVVRQMGDDPRTVAYMSDGLLQALINDFIKCNR
jgi:glycosidase